MSETTTTENSGTESERKWLVFVLGLILLLVATDLFTDRRQGVSWPHLAVELGVAFGAAAGLVLLLRESFRVRRALALSQGALAAKSLEAEQWRTESKKYVEGLSRAIDSQLDRWGLTLSEKEVAFLLLKGLSLKEIAEARKTAEKTARAQSVAVYQKSGLAGRSELAAFFLEDLLLPPEPMP